MVIYSDLMKSVYSLHDCPGSVHLSNRMQMHRHCTIMLFGQNSILRTCFKLRQKSSKFLVSLINSTVVAVDAMTITILIVDIGDTTVEYPVGASITASAMATTEALDPLEGMLFICCSNGSALSLTA